MPEKSNSQKNFTTKTDESFEASLRPPFFQDFCGQKKTVERLQLMVEAAKARGDPLQHILLSGPPGLGKTTLAYILANAMGVEIKTTSGPTLEKAGDLAGILTNLSHGSILFIDEIHRLQPAIEEYLYPAIEDFHLDIVIDQGPNARSIRLNLNHFTLIGATTRSGMVSAPLRSRFGMNCRLDYYNVSELQEIVLRSARILNIPCTPEGALQIANRSRGTPRIANNLLRWCRDFAQVRASNLIDDTVASTALKLLEIDSDGLDEMDLRILQCIIQHFNGGPVGLNSLAVAIGEEPDTIEEVHEPYLIQQGFIARTSQGRIALRRAYLKFNITPPPSSSQLNFLETLTPQNPPLSSSSTAPTNS
ncbi:MAG: Holliday junction branch migration DNA helicase RuvB [Chthoniobacterales bacterium]|nr:Holliday junction branch migration DNA helicase RuvB [Chthoniobacterales bacterium]MCX7712289.1 Holliday junction branch migration DNA helicase RuvB [Chthoniobacterales bacterium]